MSDGPALPHHLPWWFGVFLFLLWVAVVAGIVLLARRLRLRARARRSIGQRRSVGGDALALGPGYDGPTRDDAEGPD